MLAVCLVAIVSAAGCLGCRREQMPENTVASVLAAEYPTINGGVYRFPTGSDVKGTALLFFGYDCPISNSYVPEINRLYEQFRRQGIAFCLVYADADLSATAAATHADEYSLRLPAILDPTLRLAATLGARVKPEAVVLSADSKIVYRGRIDDRYAGFGQRRAAPDARELLDALQAVVDGQPVKVATAPAIGCDIDFDGVAPAQ